MEKVTTLLLCGALVVSTGCATKTQTGAVVGAGSGAVVGGVIGKAAGNTAVGAIVGAAVGGTAGAFIGSYMDRQAAEVEEDIEGAKVERIAEGIKITFDSGILFAVNRSDLQGVAQQNLYKLARILNKYSDTDILIEGHTDATGPEDYNLELSQRRAESVGAYLTRSRVDPDRFTLMGYGESQPVADNAMTDGRQANRRVDIAIMANDELKNAAQR